MSHMRTTDTPQGTAFDADQYAQIYPDGMENHYWSIARYRIVEAALPDHGSILEIGCGRGVVVSHLLSKGWDVWGAELASPPPLAGTEDRIFTGISAEKLPIEFRQSIECLMFLDVIEHIDDAPGFLATMLAAYPNASTIIVTVPARPEVWSEWDDHNEHLRRYTRGLLRAHLQEAGLRPTRIRYFFHALYLVALLIRLLGRKRDVRNDPPRNIALHRLLASCLLFENRMLTPLRFLPGLSLLASARRR